MTAARGRTGLNPLEQQSGGQPLGKIESAPAAALSDGRWLLLVQDILKLTASLRDNGDAVRPAE
ncbi:hypothetical protein [Sphingobium lactosutens]|uniref:hypothetical protein n=1 Tax=Sphingobium lactosutens TaxID=522773 RepID=UPI00041D3536|nr:hypothetical protein [Sphingobium lactosutens]